MTDAIAKKIETPALLAFARSLNPGHIAMFSTNSEEPGTVTPILVRKEPLRGLNATMKTTEAERSYAVLQVVESAELAAGDDTLVLRGKLLVRNNLSKPFSCNERDFAPVHAKKVESAQKAGFIKELATRYAINLLSGTWGWRNALESETITVTVRWNDGETKHVVSATDLTAAADSRFDLSAYSAEEVQAIEKLAAQVEKSLTSPRRGTLFRIEARLLMGENARVYPSQEWASESEKAQSKKDWNSDGSGKSNGVTRVLAKIRNAKGELQAIINDRKAGNALRVIDTWYAEAGAAPIAAEIYGANSHAGLAHRSDSMKSFFGMLNKVVSQVEMTAEETMFYLAICIRGGVLGGKE